MALRGVQYHCFFNQARSLAMAQRKTSVMGRRILLLSVAKVMLMSVETIEVEFSDPDRANAVTDSPRNLFPTEACTNFSWTSPGVVLLASMAILG